MVVTAVKTSLESESAFDLSPSGLFQIAHRAKCNQTLLELNFKEPYPSLIVWLTPANFMFLTFVSWCVEIKGLYEGYVLHCSLH